MKRIVLYFVCLAMIALSTSCQKDFEKTHVDGEGPVIPFDFDWKTTQDVALSVASPVVDGMTPEFALVNIFSSPVLSEENLLARGIISKTAATYRTVFTLPVGVEAVYVQTIIPDGSRATKMVPVTSSQLSVSGVQIRAALSAEVRALRAAAIAEVAAEARVSSMVFPVTETIPSSFDETIVTTPSRKITIGSDNLKSTYLIPADAVITGNIDMTGWTDNRTTLYVAGRLTIKDALKVEKTRLVILDGGEVITENDLTINNSFDDKASVYVFAGGKVSSKNLIFAHGRRGTMVNAGELYIADKDKKSGELKMAGGNLYTATGINTTKGYPEIKVTTSYAEIHNDGAFDAKYMKMDATSVLTNYENGIITVSECIFDQMTLNQKNIFTADDLVLPSRVTINNECVITINELAATASSNTINLASGSLFTVREECEMQQAEINMAKQSMFLIEQADDDDKDFYRNTFNGPAISSADETPVAVLKVLELEHGGSNDVFGLIEVVCDYKNNHKFFSKIKEGATLVREQTVNIPATACNGGAGNITPDPVEPEDEFEVKGAVYTYCFEDGWPWFGDYDMNDLVVVASVDRKLKAGRVEAIRINWEARASGADNSIAYAVRLDQIPTGGVASVTTTHSLAQGPFVVEGGVEKNNDYAVIPLFNSVKEVFGTEDIYVNTESGAPKTEVTKHTTTITFTTPVAEAAVIESALNYFVVATHSDAAEPERWREIHLPSYSPTQHAVVSGFNTIIESMPYKYYAMGGDLSNNGLMWGLLIPGEFCYPSEMNDIRNVYLKFMSWAKSGGATDKTWYEGDVVTDKIYR